MRGAAQTSFTVARQSDWKAVPAPSPCGRLQRRTFLGAPHSQLHARVVCVELRHTPASRQFRCCCLREHILRIENTFKTHTCFAAGAPSAAGGLARMRDATAEGLLLANSLATSAPNACPNTWTWSTQCHIIIHSATSSNIVSKHVDLGRHSVTSSYTVPHHQT